MYGWTRLAFDKVMDLINTLAPNVILLGHVKENMIDKAGTEFSSAELWLTGKSKMLTAGKSDAIGYMYRKGNENYISFKTTDEISCGSRSPHLRNKDILISKMITDDARVERLETYWDKIYIKN